MSQQPRLVVFLVLIAFASSWSAAQDVHETARSGHVDQLKKILDEHPALVNSADGDGMTPLHHAVAEGNLEAATLLISRGADLHGVNAHQETPLHVAAYEGNAAAVKMLLEHGADVTRREMRNRTALFLACNWGKDLETVKLLIDAGSDVNDKNASGEIVLVSTLYYGGKEMVDLLLDHGATIPDDGGTLQRVLWVAASNGLERPFNIAVGKCNEQGLEWWNWVSMDACARGGSVAISKALIAKGADIRAKNRYGIGPLHIAAENGRAELVEFLLSQGAEIDDPSLVGKTALHFARENGHEELAAWLVRKGASEAAPSFPILKGDYLGQEPPGETPRRFAPGIVSGHGFNSEHSPAVFSPDGREVYWTVQFRGPILFMRQENGVWTAPQPASFNSEYGDGEPFFSPDGKRLYFLSFRPTEPGGATDKENMWYVERTAQGWSEPKPVSPLINEFNLHWLVSVASSGTIYFASVREGGAGGHDIYSSRLVKGAYEEPKNLGTVINSAGIDHTPFIAPDESYLIYVSTRDSMSPGDMKFHISYRGEDGTWLEPVALDESINSIGSALCPAVTPDGKYMFFIGNGDIYWVDAGFIERLRPKKDPLAEVTYIANEGFVIEIGGQKIIIDGLFHGETIDWCHAPAPDTVKLMRAAEGPFEGIDLILITHWHSDHFTPDLVLTHMSRNPEAIVVGSPQVVSRLRADPAWADAYEARLREVDLELLGSKEMTIGGIRLKAHRIRHGAYAIKDEQTGATRNKHEDVENLAYLVEAGGVKLMHFGDAFLRENQDYFDGERFQKSKIDLVFLEGWSDETLAIIKDLMSPENVIFMHMPPEPDRLEGIARHVSSKLPGAVVFREMMERRSFGAQTRASSD